MRVRGEPDAMIRIGKVSRPRRSAKPQNLSLSCTPQYDAASTLEKIESLKSERQAETTAHDDIYFLTIQVVAETNNFEIVAILSLILSDSCSNILFLCTLLKDKRP